MAYTPTEWSTGDTITAALLNKMENGIAAGGGGGAQLLDITDTDGTLDKTWTEILDALSDGDIVRVISSGEDWASVNYVVNASTDEEFYDVYIAGANGWYQASSASGYPEFTD